MSLACQAATWLPEPPQSLRGEDAAAALILINGNLETSKNQLTFDACPGVTLSGCSRVGIFLKVLLFQPAEVVEDLRAFLLAPQVPASGIENISLAPTQATVAYVVEKTLQL